MSKPNSNEHLKSLWDGLTTNQKEEVAIKVERTSRTIARWIKNPDKLHKAYKPFLERALEEVSGQPVIIE